MKTIDKSDFVSNKLGQVDTMKVMKVEKEFESMVDGVMDLCPESPDRTAGLRLLLQAKWTLIHSITHPQHVAPPQGEKKNAKEKAAQA